MPINNHQLSQHDQLAYYLQPIFVQSLKRHHYNYPLNDFFMIVKQTLMGHSTASPTEISNHFNDRMLIHLKTYQAFVMESNLPAIQKVNQNLFLKLSTSFKRLMQNSIFHTDTWLGQLIIIIQSLIDHHCANLDQIKDQWFRQFADLIEYWVYDVITILTTPN